MAKMNKKSMHMVFLLIIIVIASSLVMVYPSSRQGMTNMDNAAPLGWDMGQGMMTGSNTHWAQGPANFLINSTSSDPKLTRQIRSLKSSLFRRKNQHS